MNKFYTRMKNWLGGLALKLFRVKIKNPEKEPQGLPFIVCCNHTSALDVAVISSALNSQVRYLSKKEVFRVPLLAQFAKAMGAIPVDRGGNDVGAVKRSIEILKGGECMGIFPQGTRQAKKDPKSTPTKNGIGMIASRSGVGILPVCIKTKRNKLGFFRKTEFIIGDYIPPQSLEFSDLNGKEKYDAITTLAFGKVCDMFHYKELPPSGGEDK